MTLPKLIEKIRAVSPASAEYIEHKAPGLDSYDPTSLGCLSVQHLFYWRETPQGHDYWDNIDKQVTGVPNGDDKDGAEKNRGTKGIS